MAITKSDESRASVHASHWFHNTLPAARTGKIGHGSLSGLPEESANSTLLGQMRCTFS